VAAISWRWRREQRNCGSNIGDYQHRVAMAAARHGVMAAIKA